VLLGGIVPPSRSIARCAIVKAGPNRSATPVIVINGSAASRSITLNGVFVDSLASFLRPSASKSLMRVARLTASSDMRAIPCKKYSSQSCHAPRSLTASESRPSVQSLRQSPRSSRDAFSAPQKKPAFIWDGAPGNNGTISSNAEKFAEQPSEQPSDKITMAADLAASHTINSILVLAPQVGLESSVERIFNNMQVSG